jgi:hypothetical protein
MFGGLNQMHRIDICSTSLASSQLSQGFYPSDLFLLREQWEIFFRFETTMKTVTKKGKVMVIIDHTTV